MNVKVSFFPVDDWVPEEPSSGYLRARVDTTDCYMVAYLNEAPISCIMTAGYVSLHQNTVIQAGDKIDLLLCSWENATVVASTSLIYKGAGIYEAHATSHLTFEVVGTYKMTIVEIPVPQTEAQGDCSSPSAVTKDEVE